MSEEVRIALLTEIPAPFRFPLFAALASLVDLRVLFLSSRDPRRPHYELERLAAAFDSQVLPGWELTRGSRWLVVNRGVGRELRRIRPDVIMIGGWNQPAYWEAVVAGRLARRPIVTWVESTQRDWRSGSSPLEIAKRRLMHASAAVVVPGRAAAEYVLDLGTSLERITIAPNAVDLATFSDAVRSAHTDRAALRRSLGVDRPLVLYVGRLAREKGLDLLLDAVAGLDVTLAVVGDGPEGDSLRSRAPRNVRFVGSVPQSGLVAWYAAADIFVLPSLSEQWGMVLNEAALSGLPLVATDAVGGAYDLIEPGRNGSIVPAGSASELAQALASLLAAPERLAAMGESSRRIAARFTPEAWAAAVAALATRLSSGGLANEADVAENDVG